MKLHSEQRTLEDPANIEDGQKIGGIKWLKL